MTQEAETDLILLMAEISEVQEKHKEALKVMGVQYPLNQAIFCLSSAMTTLKRKREGRVYKITKNGVDFKTGLLSMREASNERLAITNTLPEGTVWSLTAESLIVGDDVYKIELGA